MECIKTRRSIRKYKEDDIPQDIIDEIIDCGRHAPSGHNKQPWSFIIVRDRNKIEKLSKIHEWAPFVANAPVCIVLCCTRTKEDYKSVMYMSVACAAQNMLLAAHALGLGSCWTHINDFDEKSVEKKVREILNVPKSIDPICMLPIGYPDQSRSAKHLKDIKDIVHFDKWKNK